MKKIFTFILLAVIAISASAATNIAGEYMLQALDVQNNINRSGKVTITAGTTADTYTVTGVFPGSQFALNATYSDGKLTIAKNQLVVERTIGGENIKAILEASSTLNQAEDLILSLNVKNGVLASEQKYVVAMIREGKYANYAETALTDYSFVPVNGDMAVEGVNNGKKVNENHNVGVIFDNNVNPTCGSVTGIDGFTWLSFTVEADNTVKFSASPVYAAQDTLKAAIPEEFFLDTNTQRDGITGVLDMKAGKIIIDHPWCFAQFTPSNNYYYLGTFKMKTVITFGLRHIPGDVNLSGFVDVEDLNIVENIILGLDSAENYDGRADVNKDGVVDISDVNEIINIILGL